MDVLITIDGREAIPVRAIPLLTDWQVLPPHDIADALVGDDEGDFPEFTLLAAYQMQDGECKPIRAKWWERLLVPKIEGLGERIQQETLGKKSVKARWLDESLGALPAGAFVWRDEFEACFWRMYGPNGETIWVWEHGELIPRLRMPDIELDFSPFIHEPEKQKLVMEGFETYQAARLVAPAGAVVDTLEAPSPSSGNSPDFSKLATREQLIAAFGNFTGMNMDWFNNLKDTPALLKAREIPGQGGRGHIAEPLFCPYAVMLWLIDPKRRKGRERQPLGAEKAWQLLEDHFPMVYAAYSVGDPRQPD